MLHTPNRTILCACARSAAAARKAATPHRLPVRVDAIPASISRRREVQLLHKAGSLRDGEARVHPSHVEIWHAGRRVARHERCHSRRQHVLDLEHYLDVLGHKPGAMAGSKPLEQWRQAGRWPACYDELWERLRARHGKQNGTRAMVAVVALGREFGHDLGLAGLGPDRLRAAVAQAVSLGACDAAAVRYLLTETALHKARPDPVDVGALARYDRPMPTVADYDVLLLSGPCAGTA